MAEIEDYPLLELFESSDRRFGPRGHRPGFAASVVLRVWLDDDVESDVTTFAVNGLLRFRVSEFRQQRDQIAARKSNSDDRASVGYEKVEIHGIMVAEHSANVWHPTAEAPVNSPFWGAGGHLAPGPGRYELGLGVPSPTHRPKQPLAVEHRGQLWPGSRGRVDGDTHFDQ